MAADDSQSPFEPEAPPVSDRPQPWWARLLRRPWPPVDVLILKTRTCRLCDEACEVLESERRRLGLAIRIKDITDEPQLASAFREEVPVVFVAGKKRFIGRVDRALLRREIEALRRRRIPP